MSPEQTTKTNGPLKMHECEKSILRNMKEGKAPGNDGRTVACFRAIWQIIKMDMMGSFEEAIRTGRMATAQRQSVIRLIPKKDEYPSLIKNWRPISLMNTDTKIMAKALAERLKRVLPTIVSDEQHAFLSGRIVHDTEREQYNR